jgi:antibiotic biosynthesis monooxygenase (ABM) superfamily enzyme
MEETEMKNEPVIWLVGTQCRPEDEEKFNKWYDDVHVHMLLKGNWVKKVTRYKLANESYHVANTTLECPNYLTIYEFENLNKFESWMNGPERVAAGEDKSATWGEKGYEVIWATRYDVLNIWKG